MLRVRGAAIAKEEHFISGLQGFGQHPSGLRHGSEKGSIVQQGAADCDVGLDPTGDQSL